MSQVASTNLNDAVVIYKCVRLPRDLPMNIDVSHYGLYLTGYNIDVDNTNVSTVNLRFTTTNVTGNPMEQMDDFARDMSLMNTIRNSADPAVVDAFEKLLTTMALTNGRAMDVKPARR